MCIPHFVYPFVSRWVASTFQFLWIRVLWRWVYKDLFQSLLSILLGKYPEVEFLGHRVVLFLIIWETSIPFSTAVVPFYIPNDSVQGFHFSTSLPTLVIFCFLDGSHLNWCEVVLIVFFILFFSYFFYLFLFGCARSLLPYSGSL